MAFRVAASEGETQKRGNGHPRQLPIEESAARSNLKFMPAEDWGWRITPEEFEAWILSREDGLLVFNKPAGVVCHPSKHGPWSSLAGAAREYLGTPKLHMPFRLDRETSGVMLLTGEEALGKRLQRAVQQGHYRKTYVALVVGRMRGRVAAALPLGLRPSSQVRLRRGPLQDGTGQPALTVFVPLVANDEATLVEVLPASGRLHQIRVHAMALGHPVFGDKIYGPDETLFMEFLEQGWTRRQQHLLSMSRHALHCSTVEFTPNIIANKRRFSAPLANDIREFCDKRLDLRPPAYFAFE